MSLSVDEPPQAVVDAAGSTLLELAHRGQFATRALRGARVSSLGLTLPHEMYTMDLDDIAEGRRLDAARPTGWRYLVQEGDRTIASAEVISDGAGEARFAQFNEGPFVGATAEAVTRAESLQRVDEGSYHLRLLRIPALYVMALWLKDDSDDRDVLIPMDPGPSELQAEREYSPEEFLEALREPARRQLAFDSAPGAPAP